MPLDKNRFDTYLKDLPIRDLLFRASAWSLISALSAFYATKRGVPPIENLDRLAQSVVPLLNSLGTASILIAVFALAAKDLEAVNSSRFGQHRRAGLVGGFFRRIGGDFMLWTLGAFVSIFAAALVAVATASVGPNECKAVAHLFVRLAIFIVVFGGITYLVRREQPSPVLHLIKSQTVLLVGYGVAAVVLLRSLLRSAA